MRISTNLRMVFLPKLFKQSPIKIGAYESHVHISQPLPKEQELQSSKLVLTIIFKVSLEIVISGKCMFDQVHDHVERFTQYHLLTQSLHYIRMLSRDKK